MTGNTIQQAGEYTVDEMTILTSSGVVYDLRQMVQYIEIFEDVNRPVITGNIVIMDIDNMIENAPIIGQEFMSLKIRTPSLGEEDGIIDFSDNVFSIFKIMSKDDASMNSQIYTLSFCSPELLRSNRTKVSKSYTGSIDEIVEKVLRDERFINTRKKLIFEKTSGIRKIISPNLRPFAFIDQLKEEAMSEKYGSPHFLFYENAEGIHFRSMQSIFESGSIGEYNTGDIEVESNPQQSVENVMQRILQFQVNSNNDMLLNTRGGMLGSTMTTHNLYTKQVTSKTFDYFKDFGKYPRINENPIYNDTEIDQFDNTIGSFPNARTFVHSVSSSGGQDRQYDNPLNNYSYATTGVPDALQHRRSKVLELEFGVNVSMKLTGNTSISIGKMMDITVPVTGRVHEKEDNEFLSGKYMITKVRHMFSQADKKHEILVNACKDSLPKKYPTNADSREPFGDKSASVQISY